MRIHGKTCHLMNYYLKTNLVLLWQETFKKVQDLSLNLSQDLRLNDNSKVCVEPQKIWREKRHLQRIINCSSHLKSIFQSSWCIFQPPKRNRTAETYISIHFCYKNYKWQQHITSWMVHEQIPNEPNKKDKTGFSGCLPT